MNDGLCWCCEDRPCALHDDDDQTPLPFTCCEHCGCGTPEGEWPEREGHDDICRRGCNDSELLAPEIVEANRA